MNDSTAAQPDRDAPEAARSSQRRLLAWSGVALAALIILAAVFSFGGDTELDPDMPEGVVQDYLRAVIAGDRREARSYLAAELDGCGTRFPRYLADEAFRIQWQDTTVDEGSAWVTVSVARSAQGIFDSYRPEIYEFRLSPEPAGWRITHQEWPWYECSADYVKPEPVS